jgi:hypothetical protein
MHDPVENASQYFVGVALIIPRVVLMSLVLPVLFGLNKVKISAGLIDKLILLSACKPLSFTLLTLMI